MLHIHRTDTGALLLQSEMKGMCYGHGWALTQIDFPADLADKTKLRVVVTHDTGDLFGQLKTECPFTYTKIAHGGATDH